MVTKFKDPCTGQRPGELDIGAGSLSIVSSCWQGTHLQSMVYNGTVLGVSKWDFVEGCHQEGVRLEKVNALPWVGQGLSGLLNDKRPGQGRPSINTH